MGLAVGAGRWAPSAMRGVRVRVRVRALTVALNLTLTLALTLSLTVTLALTLHQLVTVRPPLSELRR